MQDRPAIYHWLYKYKLYHLPFWLAYHYLWWTLHSGDPLEAVHSILTTPYVFKFSFYVVFQAIGVYFNLYFLIPRYLEKGKYFRYISLVLMTVICSAWLIVIGYYAGSAWSGKTMQELYNVAQDGYFILFKNNSLPSTVAAMTFAMSIKLAKNWLQTRRKQQLLEKENLETELKFLKSQFNPHFLFNTINSIFVLIHKNPDLASDSLAKFSGLLRYQLYDCNEPQIPLGQEMAYLENFIELEKLRQDYSFELDAEMPVEGYGNLTIAPFILMPFMENAFKHISRFKDRTNWIKIDLRLEGARLHFQISNSKTSQNGHSAGWMHYSGIGLKNVRRRLDLVYPEAYELKIQDSEESFRVMLRLNLQEQPTPQMKSATG